MAEKTTKKKVAKKTTRKVTKKKVAKKTTVKTVARKAPTPIATTASHERQHKKTILIVAVVCLFLILGSVGIGFTDSGGIEVSEAISERKANASPEELENITEAEKAVNTQKKARGGLVPANPDAPKPTAKSAMPVTSASSTASSTDAVDIASSTEAVGVEETDSDSVEVEMETITETGTSTETTLGGE